MLVGVRLIWHWCGDTTVTTGLRALYTGAEVGAWLWRWSIPSSGCPGLPLPSHNLQCYNPLSTDTRRLSWPGNPSPDILSFKKPKSCYERATCYLKKTILLYTISLYIGLHVCEPVILLPLVPGTNRWTNLVISGITLCQKCWWLSLYYCIHVYLCLSYQVFYSLNCIQSAYSWCWETHLPFTDKTISQLEWILSIDNEMNKKCVFNSDRSFNEGLLHSLKKCSCVM